MNLSKVSSLPYLDQMPRFYKEAPLFSKIIASCYAILFIGGMIGNLRVISLLVKVLIHLHRQGAIAANIGSRHIRLYVLGLSIVDTLVLAALPLVVADKLHVDWRYGSIFCKLFWSCESLNKVLSTFLLLALSAHCLISVLNVRTRYSSFGQGKISDFVIAHQDLVPYLIITVCVVIAVPLMTPVYEYSDVYAVLVPLPLHVLEYPQNMTNYSTFMFQDTGLVWTHVFTKCLFNPAFELGRAFTIYIFVLAFLVPCLLQVIFYSSLIYFVYHHSRQLRRGCKVHCSIPLWRVTRRAMLLVGFYLLCWVPYWTLTLYQYSSSDDNDDNGDSRQQQQRAHSGGGDSQVLAQLRIYLPYLTHSLPYVNAAVNPSLYAYLNQMSCTDSGSSTAARHKSSANASDFVIPSARYSTGAIHQQKRLSRIEVSCASESLFGDIAIIPACTTTTTSADAARQHLRRSSGMLPNNCSSATAAEQLLLFDSSLIPTELQPNSSKCESRRSSELSDCSCSNGVKWAAVQQQLHHHQQRRHTSSSCI